MNFDSQGSQRRLTADSKQHTAPCGHEVLGRFTGQLGPGTTLARCCMEEEWERHGGRGPRPPCCPSSLPPPHSAWHLRGSAGSSPRHWWMIPTFPKGALLATGWDLKEGKEIEVSIVIESPDSRTRTSESNPGSTTSGCVIFSESLNLSVPRFLTFKVGTLIRPTS